MQIFATLSLTIKCTVYKQKVITCTKQEFLPQCLHLDCRQGKTFSIFCLERGKREEGVGFEYSIVTNCRSLNGNTHQPKMCDVVVQLMEF
jgi:hypothetical protein